MVSAWPIVAIALVQNSLLLSPVISPTFFQALVIALHPLAASLSSCIFDQAM